MRITSRVLASALTLTFVSPAARCQQELLELREPGGGAARFFGSAVALGGGRALVGAPSTLAPGGTAGSAYVYDAATGQLLRTLSAPGPGGARNSFGLSLAVDGPLAIVGAPFYPDPANATGAAFVFDLATGALIRTFAGPPGSHFGECVDLDGERAIVGSRYEGGSGMAYVFDVTTGVTLTALSAPPECHDDFGHAVAISGEQVVVGSPYSGNPFGPSGGAWVFGAASGVLQHTLLGTAVGRNDEFGGSVALEGPFVLVGAPGHPQANLFELATGQELHIWQRGFSSSQFGRSVSLGGTTAVIGDPRTSGSAPGTAWIYDAESGAQLAGLTPGDSEAGDRFGGAVAVDGARILIGASGRDDLGTNSGAAYLFAFPPEADTAFCFGDGSGSPCPCGNESDPDVRVGCLHSQGIGAALRSEGAASLSADSLVLRGAAMPNQPVLYFQGAASHAPVPFGDGLTCVGGPFVRLGTKINVQGGSSYPGSNDLPISLRGMIPAPGTRFYYQARFRDPATFCTAAAFNWTNAVQIDWLP